MLIFFIPEQDERCELGERDDERCVPHVCPEVVVLAVVLVAADESERLNVGAGHAQADQGLSAEGAVVQTHLRRDVLILLVLNK